MEAHHECHTGLWMWRISLSLKTGSVSNKTNRNTETVLVDRPTSEFLSDHPAPIENIFNAYELKKQPDIMRY